MLSPMSAPITTATTEQDALEGRRDGGAGDDHDGVAGHEQPDQHARLEHDREAREERPQHGVDALHGVEQPREELVHTPSLERQRGPLAWEHVRSRSIAVPLDGWRDPASVFAAVAAPRRRTASGWMPGPTADDGLELGGHGRAGGRSPNACGPCRSTAPIAARAWEAGRFRGGWIGWLGYEDAAARAGAPVERRRCRRARASGGCACERFVAFDHAHGARVGGRARRRGCDAFAERRSPRPTARPPPARAATPVEARRRGTSPASTPR